MNIGIDLGKRRSYIVMQEGNVVVKEGYTDTSREGFEEFFGEERNATIVVESSSSTNKIANILEGYNVVVANPLKVRIIAESDDIRGFAPYKPSARAGSSAAS
jgi:hypothetical protein